MFTSLEPSDLYSKRTGEFQVVRSCKSTGPVKIGSQI